MAAAPIKLTHRMLSQSRVIAKGNRIREVKRLVAEYGGRAAKWAKKSSPEIDIDGKKVEYHWYEHPGVGRFEIREVEINQP
jgi:hypothetical protein